MEQKKYKQINTKTPEIQEMILSYQIGGVAYELSQRLEISPALALDLFYRSKFLEEFISYQRRYFVQYTHII